MPSNSERRKKQRRFVVLGFLCILLVLFGYDLWTEITRHGLSEYYRRQPKYLIYPCGIAASVGLAILTISQLKPGAKRVAIIALWASFNALLILYAALLVVQGVRIVWGFYQLTDRVLVPGVVKRSACFALGLIAFSAASSYRLFIVSKRWSTERR